MIIQGKVWGKTSPLFNKNNVEIHRICAKKDSYCSKHKHEHKFNMFFLENGQLRIDIWKKDYDLVDVTILNPGESCIVEPNEYHCFRAIQDTICYEIYYVELDPKDIVRKSVGGKE